jgi:hypothetical protein
MIKTRIEDGKGRGHHLGVTKGGKVCTLESTAPPAEEDDLALPFRQYFTDDGLATGSEDMLINGATTPTDFYISAREDVDLYIKNIAVIIADAGATASKFGNLSALTNGVRFFWSNQAVGEIEIDEGLKTNLDFVRLGLGTPAFGSAANAYRVPNIEGNSEGYIPNIDMTETFGLPWGVRLRAGTTDKLVFTVRDNISGLDRMDIVGYGISVKRV